MSWAVKRVGDVWQVGSNGNWNVLPQDLCRRLSASCLANPAAVVKEKGLFGQPGTFLFNLINMTVIDVSLSQLINYFIPVFSTLAAQRARTVTITAADVVASFVPLNGQGAAVPQALDDNHGIAVPQVFVDYIGALPPNEPIFDKVHVARPKNVSRADLGDSYSDRLYRWVWNKVMDLGAVPKAGDPGVQLRNVIFVNNPSLLQQFTAAVGKLGVSHPPQAAASHPSDLEAAMLESLCTEHPFLRNNKAKHPFLENNEGRIALMMHLTDDLKERVILSCGFSMELNKEECAIGRGIAFTSNHRYAISQFRDDRFLGLGRVCVLFSWVAIGQPYFVRQYMHNRQPGYATHFGLTHNGGFHAVNGAELDSPVVVSFEPELCCPFAVAELDLIPSSPSKQTNAKQAPLNAPIGH